MSEILNLDALNPQPKKVKLNGKIIECYPPKVLELIELQQIFASMKGISEIDELDNVAKKFRAKLSKTIPDLEKENIDLSLDQMITLYQYLQNVPTQQVSDNLLQEDNPSKKNPEELNSQEPSPTLSEPIQPTN